MGEFETDLIFVVFFFGGSATVCPSDWTFCKRGKRALDEHIEGLVERSKLPWYEQLQHATSVPSPHETAKP